MPFDDNWKSHTIVAILSSVTTLMVGWLTIQQSTVEVGPAGYEAMFGRIEKLEDETERLSNLYFEARTENSLLKMQLDALFSISPRGTIVSYLDSLRERPAWCKEYDPDKNSFTMFHINPSYENFYGVTAERYEGQTDIEIFGESIGASYLANDLVALQRKGFQEFEEVVITSLGDTKVLEFWKFYVPLPDMTELVCGIQVTM